MAFEKFHHKIVTGLDDEGEPIKERVTLPKFGSIPFGLIRKNRKLPQEEQFFALLEAVASEEDLEKMDKAPQEEMEGLMTAWQEDSGVTSGGIDGLLELIDGPHGKALEIDLLYAGHRLRWVGSDDFTWRDLKLFISGSQLDSELFKSLHPEEAGWSRTNMLLANIADSLAWLVWAKTKDGSRNRNQPQPIKRPGVRPLDRRVKGVAVPIDQFRKQMDELRARVRSSSAEEQVTRISVRREKEGNESGD
ncbi:tail assembly chaperone [Gordonia phage Dre3]|uniref:Tail assembly chaperone n=1 Tax=Gordonia phage Gibbous TaxID=2652405 RepID=A0A5J6TA78_9CAUD|nr:tail assembly chaperone [Gordonia phage Gibbous]QFG05145.1 tail assembly chaperone [Gordonia phage Gibbous]QRI45944.1 tail assembly chaperone [Gordonia phage Dre3]